jgi:hypothetical protein
MNKFAELLAGLDWKIEIDWLGSHGVHYFDEMRRVVIEAQTTGYAEHYSGLNVTLIHKLNGTVAAHFFFFHDHIPAENLTDGGNEHGKTVKLHLWQHRDELDWYILRPKDKAATRPFCEVVEAWINQWR